MEWNFLIPALAFLLVTAVVAMIGLARPSADGSPQTGRGLLLIPGVVAAALAWLGERLIESWILGFGGSVHFLVKGSDEPTQNVLPWVGLVYFVAMVAGMLAHTTWEAITRRKGKTKPGFDKWLYLRPALVAPIIFLGVLKLVGGNELEFQALLLSFQNGFFWQTVLSKH